MANPFGVGMYGLGALGRGVTGAFGGVAGALVGGGGQQAYQGAPADPRNPAFTSANAPRVQQDAQGQWTLTEHGNTRVLQLNEVADAQGYANQFWQDNPTGFQANNPLSVPDAYQQFLGRTPSADELAVHQNNRGGTVGVIQTILQSPEMRARMAPGSPPPGTAYTPPPSSAPGHWGTGDPNWASPDKWDPQGRPPGHPDYGKGSVESLTPQPGTPEFAEMARQEEEWQRTHPGWIQTAQAPSGTQAPPWMYQGAPAANPYAMQPLGAFGRGSTGRTFGARGTERTR